ncbi:MAG: response regulator [Candidatus Muirbacterium halophilum]|nr:response regulator [Candidatus Muirbacterium halophilum]MCK9476202.1 response regulator [Candidatus Muirbacterium halophilum]
MIDEVSIQAVHKANGEKFRFLLVDDSAFMVKNLERVVKILDGEVVGSAGNGREAIKLYKSTKPDIVTMDITMPDMDGIQAVEGIMADDPNAVIVMVSALGHQDMVKEAIVKGAKYFIVKPFKIPDACNIIKNFLIKMGGK